MKSEIWKVDYKKAFYEGYSIEQINLFNVEAELLLRQLINHFKEFDGEFHFEKKDKEILIYLILNELINSLYDALEQLKKGNIRMASRVFRDVMENRHIIKLINTKNGEKYVSKWFENEVLQNSLYRDVLKQTNPNLSNLTSEIYRKFSKYAHRTYEVIIDNYTSKNELLYFHRNLELTDEIHLKIISRYYIHLSQFILDTGYDPIEYNLLSKINLGLMMSNLSEI